MRGHLDHQAATRQLMPFPRCDGVHGLEGHAVQVAMLNTGWEDTLAP